MQRKYVRMMFGALALGVCSGMGCSGTRDLLTSQRFRDRPFETIFGSEDPVEVLVNNPSEGDARVRAMRKLDEPSKNGKAGQQDQVMTILQTSATTDQRALCRLAAVEALARFDDPRAVSILLTAYQNAPYENPAAGTQPVQTVAGRTVTSTFTPEAVKMLQCQVLEALGKHRHPDALKLLCEVAAMPTEKPKPAIEPAGGLSSFDFGGASLPEVDRNDVRLAAIRSLGKYDNESLAIKTLVGLLQTERDVAIIGRTHESLMAITGHDFPPDGAVWADWLAKDGKPRKAGLFN